ncbi:uncharacterized protein AMSG_09259 [Thecamonas trahens ATCC 50062]|uniref:Trafficking protein particle complex subunit 11 domain-containing protein n=1 Tax=Thecamonas trahens ATCC 50062 TaxID=461836 RepID=A0A0L0DLG3_THETB|nr:hypothetical protein AMSG_09259 [Thecamonas trahens ATCC 50062]KNC53179.1 hypothetical protein AMSG_09259 [Thecamonas trahens ATCC 50062]|eukprot:XP_013754651.1 hypothetical protein AMSG_09259 [Thecamonas trahens ATCC 50062]
MDNGADADLGALVEPEPEPEHEAEPKPEPEHEAGHEAEPKPEPEQEAEHKAEPKPDTAPADTNNSPAKHKSKAKSKSKPKAKSKSKPKSKASNGDKPSIKSSPELRAGYPAGASPILTPTAMASGGYLTSTDTHALGMVYADPGGAMAVIAPRLEAHMPFRNVICTSIDNKSGMYIGSVSVTLSRETPDLDGGRNSLSQYWHLLPVLRIFVLTCETADTYKRDHRQELKSWLTRVAALPVPAHWLVLHSLTSKIKSDLAPFVPKTSGGPRLVQLVLDAHEREWLDRARGAPQGSRPSPLASPPNARKYEELTTELAAGLMAGFNARILAFRAEISHITASIGPGWNYCRFFVVKEGLALLYEQASLHIKALEIYEHLSGMHRSGEVPHTPGVLDTFGTVDFDLAAQLFTLSALPYRGLMFESKISLLEFHVYVTGRRVALLASLGYTDQMADVALAFLSGVVPQVRSLPASSWILRGVPLPASPDAPFLSPLALVEAWQALAALGLLPILEAAAGLADEPDAPQPLEHRLIAVRLVSYAAAHLGAFGAAIGALPYTSFEAALRSAPADSAQVWTLPRQFETSGLTQTEPTALYEVASLSALELRDAFYVAYNILLAHLVAVHDDAGRSRTAALFRAELGYVALVRGDYAAAAGLLAGICDIYHHERWPSLYGMAMLQLAATQRAALAGVAAAGSAPPPELVTAHATTLIRVLSARDVTLPSASLANSLASELVALAPHAALSLDASAVLGARLSLAGAALQVARGANLSELPLGAPFELELSFDSALAAPLPVVSLVLQLVPVLGDDNGRGCENGEVFELTLTPEPGATSNDRFFFAGADGFPSLGPWAVARIEATVADALVLVPLVPEQALVHVAAREAPWTVVLEHGAPAHRDTASELVLAIAPTPVTLVDPRTLAEVTIRIEIAPHRPAGAGPVLVIDSGREPALSGSEHAQLRQCEDVVVEWVLSRVLTEHSWEVRVPVMGIDVGTVVVGVEVQCAAYAAASSMVVDVAPLLAPSLSLLPGREDGRWYAQLKLTNIAPHDIDVADIDLTANVGSVSVNRASRCGSRSALLGRGRTVGALFDVQLVGEKSVETVADVVVGVGGVGVWRERVPLVLAVPRLEVEFVLERGLVANVFTTARTRLRRIDGKLESVELRLTLAVDSSAWLVAGKTSQVLQVGSEWREVVVRVMPLRAGQLPMPQASVNISAASEWPVAYPPRGATIRILPPLEMLAPALPDHMMG